MVMMETNNYWHDRDVKPYVEGENEFYDKVLTEIVDKALERNHKDKSEKVKVSQSDSFNSGEINLN